VGDVEDWIAVSSGQSNTCGLRAGGTLWCWGLGSDAVLPFGEDDVPTPRQVGTESGWSDVSINTFGGCAIREEELWCWGRNAEGQLGLSDAADRYELTRVGDESWEQVSAGRFHNCARRTDGSAWCAGENIDGRLGVGDWDRRNDLSPVLTVDSASR
jgi:alpha-tubulin suppressor-like RCC1 family protein